ncbi:Uncharacterised protein [Vibrio cholerae]|nr:Uncharacterised protein [Vibrio cholerae]CSB99574.1 Uncharacterised protein [Vibrio cholerae]
MRFSDPFALETVWCAVNLVAMRRGKQFVQKLNNQCRFCYSRLNDRARRATL